MPGFGLLGEDGGAHPAVKSEGVGESENTEADDADDEGCEEEEDYDNCYY
jgi:hypothetical protein